MKVGRATLNITFFYGDVASYRKGSHTEGNLYGLLKLIAPLLSQDSFGSPSQNFVKMTKSSDKYTHPWYTAGKKNKLPAPWRLISSISEISPFCNNSGRLWKSQRSDNQPECFVLYNLIILLSLKFFIQFSHQHECICPYNLLKW